MSQPDPRSTERERLLRIGLRWGLAGAGVWLALALVGPVLLGSGGHPPASAFVLPALALPSILFRIGAGFGISWLAEASMLVAAPLAWALLAAALGLVFRGGGTTPGPRGAFSARALGFGVLFVYVLSFLAPLALLELPGIARWAIRSEGDAVRTRAVETLAQSGSPDDVPRLTAALEDSLGVYPQMRAAACGVTRWGGVEAWRAWGGTPGGAEALPQVIWTVVDILGNPSACPGPPIQISTEDTDALRVDLVHRVVTRGLDSSDTGDRYRALQLIQSQLAPAEREPHIPRVVGGLGDPFFLHRAASLRVLLEARDGSRIREPVPWQDLGEVDPETATAAEVEECQERWSRWLAGPTRQREALPAGS